MAKRLQRLLGLWLLLAAPVAAGEVVEADPGEAVERHLPADVPFRLWAQDPDVLRSEAGDRLEERAVVAPDVRTVKLKNVVPPIRFASGVAEIPPSYVERLRQVLDGMRHLTNVRLHLVGHADDQPLSGALAEVYGDNAGLSRERAGEVAEFIQGALALPPEAISFEWAGASQPVASNDTDEGRARNRRVEVEVWYDEVGERLAVEEVVVPHEIKRVKVCRIETVCKLRYREGHARRARIRNLVAPLHPQEGSAGVPDSFIREIGQALENLRNEQNVTVKFIGFSDDAPLTGRAERIYGTHLALSKAMAHRVALGTREALQLPSSAVASDGRGTARPVASNDTPQGRALNRRVEVEFWHDDPLQELANEPQPCPDAADAEFVTKVYDPPWKRIEPLAVEDGEPVIPPGYADDLRRAMEDLADKTNVRLRFVGYTANQRLDRRTAMVYGDDVGLSVARARRTMQKISAELGLSPAQTEHEGRGYLHSNDVVNAGFLQGETSHVVVQVVHDELAVIDDWEGVEITPLTRELTPKDPLALNLMRITVDGEPIDDPGRSSSDVQRCTDVALESADIRFRFDELSADRRLSVTARPAAVPVQETPDGGLRAPPVLFATYSNYPHFIDRSEVRIFRRGGSVRAMPLAVVEVGPDGLAEWQPAPKRFPTPVRELEYVLRAYDAEGRFDETAPQVLWMVYGGQTALRHAELAAAYGESGPLLQNIPLKGAGSVQVHGSGIPPEHTVWLGGEPLPVDADGNFVAEALLPPGLHTVEVAVLDAEGNGELFLRDLELERNDWFYVGIADVTVGWNQTSGPVDELTGGDAPQDLDSWADGRLAFYVNGRFGEDWSLTASADTREGPWEDLFTNFLDKSPESLFRRMDPDYYYPTFGDDGTVEEMAPTLGKFYVKLRKGDSHALWGNFRVGYGENELALVERGLYGANLRYQSPATTRFGERRLVLDGFAADPGTVASRDEFRGTGGSLYFLRRQDILVGSERVRIELRDKGTGIVNRVVSLSPTADYDIDHLQGRILLSEPLGATADDGLLVRSEGLSGDEAWLVVQYEYTPGLDEPDALAAGGQAGWWVNDFVKLGLTANRNDLDGAESSLYGADLTLRLSSASWLKLQAGHSDGLVSSSLRSDDGGFRFLGGEAPDLDGTRAGAYRADLSIGFGDLFERGRGNLTFYAQRLDAGYSAPGLGTLTDTEQLGGTFGIALTDHMQLFAKADHSVQERGIESTTQELDVAYQFARRWSLSTGFRHEIREDDSPVVPVTQEEGERTDAVVQVAYEPSSRWNGYGFAQGTLRATESMDDNRRIGLGGAYRLNERILLEGEASYGDSGPAARLGTSYQQSEQTHHYLSYTLENERGSLGLHERRGNLVHGARTRLSDSASVFVESRYQHADSMNGLTRAMGVSLAPSERWSLGANWEIGSLFDRDTRAETRRKVGGARLGYRFDRLLLSLGVEYRSDETEQLDGTWSDRTTWLFRNSLRVQITPDWRLVGKFNHAFSDSSLGEFYDGGFTEAVLGYAYRPVKHDRLNVLAKYTYFYNVPTTDQLGLLDVAALVIQKSHVASLDLMYDLTPNWSVGLKYAYRLGQVSLDRENPDFFDNDAHLYILRSDYRFLKNWEGSAEGRMLELTHLRERRTGALFALYRYLGEHFKIGIGYNFTDFSDDLTDLSYDHHGPFFNLIGTL